MGLFNDTQYALSVGTYTSLYKDDSAYDNDFTELEPKSVRYAWVIPVKIDLPAASFNKQIIGYARSSLPLMADIDNEQPY